MNDVMTQNTYEQLDVTTERTLPAAPFPRKYVHSVFDDLQDALQAVLTLLGAGYDARDVHILSGGDCVEAVEQRQTLLGFLCSFDYDVYLKEARQGRHILVVRLSTYEQMRQVRDLLTPHHAHLMKYIDTWTVSDLIS